MILILDLAMKSSLVVTQVPLGNMALAIIILRYPTYHMRCLINKNEGDIHPRDTIINSSFFCLMEFVTLLNLGLDLFLNTNEGS